MFKEMTRLLPKEVQQIELSEPKAQCGSCSMARPKYKGKYPYQPDLKCCTFHPLFPHYVIGALLSSESHEPVKTWIHEKVDKRQYALPLGIVPNPSFQVAFNHREASDFGNKEEWLCPLYNRSLDQCNGWEYRGSVCTTFFCKNSYGPIGKKLREKLANYLWYIETALLEEVLVLMDFSPRQVMEQLSFHNMQEAPQAWLKGEALPEKKYKELWNGYSDPIEFYKKSYQIMKGLNRKDLVEILGETGENLEDEMIQLAIQFSQIQK